MKRYFVKILFVCKSNAARSQMAEAMFKQMCDEHEALSAGIRVAFRGKQGKPVPTQISSKMQEIGIDMSKMRRKQLTAQMVAEADKVVVIMTRGQCVALLPSYLKGSQKAVFWYNVRDPKNDSERYRARDAIVDLVENLVLQIRSSKT